MRGDFLRMSFCFETQAKDRKSPPSFVVSTRLAKNAPFTLAAATGAAAGKSRSIPAARDSNALRHFDKSLRESTPRLTDFRAKTANASRTWGLHRCTGKRVLDLRCGGGFFLYLLTQLGHEVLGLDIDEFPLFGDLINLFGVPHVVWAIEAFKELPDLGARFDYITAFATRFNRSAERDWYRGPSKWNFFLDDLEHYLAPGGQIFFPYTEGAEKEIITRQNCASFS